MKSIIGKDTFNSNQNRTFCINGKSTTNVSNLVNEFNPLSYVNTLNNSIVVPEISITEVINVIRSLKQSSSG